MALDEELEEELVLLLLDFRLATLLPSPWVPPQRGTLSPRGWIGFDILHSWLVGKTMSAA